MHLYSLTGSKGDSVRHHTTNNSQTRKASETIDTFWADVVAGSPALELFSSVRLNSSLLSPFSVHPPFFIAYETAQFRFYFFPNIVSERPSFLSTGCSRLRVWLAVMRPILSLLSLRLVSGPLCVKTILRTRRFRPENALISFASHVKQL